MEVKVGCSGRRRESKAGRMTRHRMIVSILVVMSVLLTATRSSARANSLLSGYGGPGEGNQAILGSALLGGTGGGGGSSGGSSGSAGSSPTGTAGVGVQAGQKNAASTGSSGGGSTTRGGGRRSAGGASVSRGESGDASDGTARTYSVLSRGETSQAASEDSETLGLSGDDLLFILLALCTLAFTGVLTRRLTRITAAGRHE
jgi:hypothetical protein